MTKKIHILATGGTIAGQANTHGGYTAGKLNVETLLDALPWRPHDVQVSYEQVANVGSQSIHNEIWYQLANRVNTLSLEKLADGIVITHGTDTMEETAYFLNLVTPGKIPVVLTGAMRPANAFSPDGPENLLAAINVACSGQAKNLGVLVVMNSIIHSARYIQKMGVSQDNAFQSIPLGSIGIQRGTNTHFFVNQLAAIHTNNSEFTKAIENGSLTFSNEFKLPNVNVLYVHAGMDESYLRQWLQLSHEGIVVAGVGAGNLSQTLERLLANQVFQGVAVVRSTRIAAGNIARNMEIDDDRHGFLVAGNLTPAKARILLQLALAVKMPMPQMQTVYDTH